MAGKKFYGEAKSRLNLSLTKTAVKWLEAKQNELTARSLSDAIERMAREESEAQQCKEPRTPGLLKGELGDAFFEPLPEEELQQWG